jgi:phage terminase Nu1 subunit (DNA packaging protein)
MPPRLHRRATDALNGVGNVIDPTKNVLDLVDAAVMRIDDMAELRAVIADEKIARMEREWIHLEAMASLREQHAREARESEAKRLDAIRDNDRSTLTATTAQSQQSIQALATAATTTAEVLRNNTERVVSPILDRLTSIETTVNRGIGRSAVADPQISELMIEMRKLSTSRDIGTGKSEGMSDSAKLLIGALTIMTALMGAYTFSQKAAATAAPVPPITIVMPATAPGITTTTTQPVPTPLVPR